MLQFKLVLVVLLLIGVYCQNQDGISYGKPAREGQFPYQAQFSVVKNGTERHTCGGALISNQWILSAAHCYPEYLKDYYIQVYLGSIDAKDINARIPIAKFIKHPNYRDGIHMTSDIMLVKLATPVTYTDLLQPIRLPEKDLPQDYFVGKKIVVSGFGTTESGDVSDVLLFANLTVISNQECAAWFGPQDPYTNEWICTIPGANGENPCTGDSGGPVAGIINDESVLMGVASRVLHPLEDYDETRDLCGINPLAAIYTRVSLFLDWIQETMDQN